MGAALSSCFMAWAIVFGAAPGDPLDAYVQAMAQSSRHEKDKAYAQAIAVLLKHREARDGEYLFNARLGWLHYLDGKYADSERYYQKAMKLSPKSVEAKLGCLLPMLAAARYREAETLARAVVKSDSRNYYGNLRLIVALRLQQKTDEATELAKSMLLTYPADGYFMGEMAHLNGSRKALGAPHSPSSDGNRSIDEAMRASHKAETENKHAEAIQVLQESYAANPTDYAINLRLGWLNYRHGDYSRSADHYYAAIQAAPRATEAGVGYLLPLLAQGRYKEAETFARQILGSDPGNYYGALRLAAALRLQGEYAAADKVLKPMREAYPADIHVMNETALLAAAQGDAKAAKQLFASVLSLDPENETAKRELAKP